MKIQISKKEEVEIVENPTVEKFIELNEEYTISIPGKMVYFSEPFNCSIQQSMNETFSKMFPLLSNKFYKDKSTIEIGDLKRDPLLLKAIRVCYALNEVEKNEIYKYLNNGGSSNIIQENTSVFMSGLSNTVSGYKAGIFCYLIRQLKTALALENRELFESKEFSIDFMLDVYGKLEELDVLLDG